MSTVKYRLKKPYITVTHSYEVGEDVYFNGEKYLVGFESFTKEQMNNNPDWFELIEESKEWEILEYNHKEGILHDTLGGCGCPIKSVKRLSDGEVFSLGDEVKYFGIWNKIIGFETYTGAMCAKVTTESIKWFTIAPIKDLIKFHESKPQDTFTWTDELVKEFVRINFNRQDHNYLPHAIKEFKQSKTTQPKEEKIKVNIGTLDSGGQRGIPHQYPLVMSDPIPVEKIPLIKEAIERVLNNEQFTMITTSPNLYTKEAMDKAIADAWEGAKSTIPYPSGLVQLVFKYPTLNAYLKTIKH